MSHWRSISAPYIEALVAGIRVTDGPCMLDKADSGCWTEYNSQPGLQETRR